MARLIAADAASKKQAVKNEVHRRGVMEEYFIQSAATAFSVQLRGVKGDSDRS
jgi:hypothetical protein